MYYYNIAVEVEPGSMTESDIASCLALLLYPATLRVREDDGSTVECRIVKSNVQFVVSSLAVQPNCNTHEANEAKEQNNE